MAENSQRNARGEPISAAAPNGTGQQAGAPATATSNMKTGAVQPPKTLDDKSRTPANLASTAPNLTTAPSTSAAQATVKCSKCGAAVREVARFCQRCHATMRYECPACGHQQRTGGNCEKCGVNFIKYIGAVVAAKQAEADMIHDKIEQRSALMKNLLFIPLTGGLSLIRQLLVGRDRKS